MDRQSPFFAPEGLYFYGFALLICIAWSGCGDSTQKPSYEDQEGLPTSAIIELTDLTPEECVAAYPDVAEPYEFCEHPSRPKLFRFKGKLCAYHATHTDEQGPMWEELRFGFRCFDIRNVGSRLEATENNEILGANELKQISRPQEFPVASTPSGAWFGRNFLNEETTKGNEDENLPSYGWRELAFADIMDEKGELNPDGIDDAIFVFTDKDSTFDCDGEELQTRALGASVFPGKQSGGFGSARKIETGWGSAPLHPFGVSTLGENAGGELVLALPVERNAGASPNIDQCLSGHWKNMPLIGMLRPGQNGALAFESLINNQEDLVVLNQNNPMGFARVPDGTGFLGSFSGMAGESNDSGFSHISMDGTVSHWSMTYKGNTYPLSYVDMEIDYGGTPFDLALADRDDGTLLLIHTSRTSNNHYEEVNGLYITFLRDDGTQKTESLYGNGKPVGLITFEDISGGRYFATASGFSAGAWALGLPHEPQILIWYADGVRKIPPFTSEGYFASPLP